jgi:alkylglycerol monooxygenase
MDFLAKNSETIDTFMNKTYTIRSIFYLLSPNETFFENIEDVPDLTQKASDTFVLLVLIEQLISLIKNGRLNGKPNDVVASVSAAIISRLP